MFGPPPLHTPLYPNNRRQCAASQLPQQRIRLRSLLLGGSHGSLGVLDAPLGNSLGLSLRGLRGGSLLLREMLHSVMCKASDGAASQLASRPAPRLARRA